MKKLPSFALFFALLTLASCSMEAPSKPGSNGKTCEILVVCNLGDYQGAVGDSLRAFFQQDNPALNQSEPLFSLAHIPYSSFEKTDMFKHMRNIILIQIGEKAAAQAQAPFLVQQDAWARNQIVFQFAVNDKASFDHFFAQKKELMLKAFYSRERIRIQQSFKSTESVRLSDRMLKKFGFKLVFPEGFRIATDKPGVMTFNKETKHYGQNVMVYTYPYTAESFQEEDILRTRNYLGKTFIEGSIDSSYMITETQLPPIFREVNFNGKYAIETRGLWRLEGDFMGGPFVNYVFLDESSKKVIMIDAFLFSPRRPKRDLMMQLESIAYSFSLAPTTDTVSPK